MLWLVQRIFYGPESRLAASKPGDDLHFGELAVVAPLVVLMLAMGLAPTVWLRTIEKTAPPPHPMQQVRYMDVMQNSIPSSYTGEAQR